MSEHVQPHQAGEVTTPTTAAGRALREKRPADADLHVAILAIEAEARAEAEAQERGLREALRITTDQLLALREALIADVFGDEGDPDGAPDVRSMARRALEDTEAAAQEARERIEAPWREVVEWCYEHEGIVENDVRRKARALLDKGGDK